MLALLLSALVLPVGAMAADGASSLHAHAIAAGSKVGAPDAAAPAGANAGAKPVSALAWVAGAPLVVCTALLWIGLFVRLRARRPSEREAHAAAFAAAEVRGWRQWPLNHAQTVPAASGRLSALSVSHSKSGLYGAFACKARAGRLTARVGDFNENFTGLLAQIVGQL